MEKAQLLEAISKSRENSKKRNFTQTFDLIINLKGLDLKKPEHQVDLFVTLPHSKGKKAKVCALVGPEMAAQAKEVFDGVISSEDFVKYKDKKDIKKVANSYDFFIAQATIMPRIATTFGRVFGPRGKMPNPKSGAVVPPNANLKALYEKFQKTIRVSAKTAPLIQFPVGTESMEPNHVVENAFSVYNSVIHALPNEKHNVKDVYLKLTMGVPVKIGEKIEVMKEA